MREHEEAGLDQRLLVLGQLNNAVVRDARSRVKAMKRDPRWQSHAAITDGIERSKAYAALRREHGVSEMAVRELARAHWGTSKWMPDLLDCRAANALGREVWAAIEAWLYRGAGCPRTNRPGARDSAWGNDLSGGLRITPDPRKQVIKNLRDVRLTWSTQAISRSKSKLGSKRLELAFDWSCMSTPRRKFVLENLSKLRMAGVKRTTVRGKNRYCALLVLDCAPYRSEKHKRRVAERPSDEVLGLDMGPTHQWWVAGDESGVISLGQEALSRASSTAAKQRRVQRALARSRRASNPDCYDEKGRSIRGKRPRELSGRGKRLASQHAEAKRKSAEQRKHATIRQARETALLAPRVRVEDQNFTSWMAGYGRRLAVTLPGLFLSHLTREQEINGGSVERLPLRSAFSQYCICGHKARKPRSQDWHECNQPDCPIRGVRLDRNLFSAFLMRVTASPETSVERLHEGSLATTLIHRMSGEPVLQESLTALCAIRRGRAKRPEGMRSRASQRDRLKGAGGRTARGPTPTHALPAQGRPDRALAGTDERGNAAHLGHHLIAESLPRPPCGP